MRTEFLKIPSMEQWLRLDCSPDLLQDIKRPNTLYWQTRRNIEKVWHMGPNPGRQTKNGGKSTFPYPTATHLKRIWLRKQLLIITHDDIDHNQWHMGTACLPFSRRLTKKQEKNEHTNSLCKKTSRSHLLTDVTCRYCGSDSCQEAWLLTPCQVKHQSWCGNLFWETFHVMEIVVHLRQCCDWYFCNLTRFHKTHRSRLSICQWFPGPLFQWKLMYI